VGVDVGLILGFDLSGYDIIAMFRLIVLWKNEFFYNRVRVGNWYLSIWMSVGASADG
jgi:hypothetical protein